MREYKKVVLVTAALLVLTTVAVLAQGTDNVKDWWAEMTDHHEETHGDDFEAHHQGMHGDDWQEHVASCHETTETGDMGTGGRMGAGMGSMMGATL